jgi:DNA processing protein
MAADVDDGASRACAQCLRRSWLLAELSAVLDYSCRADGRLVELLALDDEQLMLAIGGRRRAELKRRHARFATGELRSVAGVAELCRHDRRYPHALRRSDAPPLLHVAGGVERLGRLAAGPVVAMLGSRRATDYGLEMASSLARGLAASGVTVASELCDGIALASQQGALQVDGATVTVMPGGIDVAASGRRRPLCERLRRSGCVVSELPCGVPARRWGTAAAQRTLVAMAAVTVVVEAEDSPRELAAARIARALGRPVAAVPGRVTSPLSGGTHTLLLQGARLIRGAADVLDLLYGARRAARAQEAAASPWAGLTPRLKATLEKVGAGMDTPGKLIGEHDDRGELLLALSELELMGLLARGHGGRYLPRDPLPPAACPPLVQRAHRRSIGRIATSGR